MATVSMAAPTPPAADSANPAAAPDDEALADSDAPEEIDTPADPDALASSPERCVERRRRALASTWPAEKPIPAFRPTGWR